MELPSRDMSSLLLTGASSKKCIKAAAVYTLLTLLTYFWSNTKLMANQKRDVYNSANIIRMTNQTNLYAIAAHSILIYSNGNKKQFWKQTRGSTGETLQIAHEAICAVFISVI